MNTDEYGPSVEGQDPEAPPLTDNIPAAGDQLEPRREECPTCGALGYWTTERRPEDDRDCDRFGCANKTHPVHHWVAAPTPEAAGLQDWVEQRMAESGGTDPLIAASDILAALSAPSQADRGLDAAWAEAEAALPEGWRGPVLRRSSIVGEAYQAQVFNEDGDDLYEYADAPAAALRALDARLSQRATEPLP